MVWVMLILIIMVTTYSYYNISGRIIVFFFYFPGVSTFGFYLQNTRWINDFLFPISRADVLSPHYSRRSARFSLWGRTRHPARHSEFHRSSARLSQQHLLISIFSDNGRGILPRKLFEILCILLRVFLLSATEI